MKLLTTLSLLAIVSCGASMKPSDKGNLGQIRNAVVSPASSAIKSGLSGLCQALRDKETNFRLTYLPSNTVFNFDSSYKDCTNNAQTSQVKTRLVESGSGLQFNLLSGQYFSMGLETATNGNLAVLCRDISNLTNPMIISGSTALWFDFVPEGLCDNGNTNTKCLQMEIGFKQPSEQYLVSITDRYDVSIVAGNLSGMVKNHLRTDLSTCAPGARIESSSVFKGISAN
jgi:hypothetical protein